MNAADRAQYKALLGMMREAAERFGAADADVRRAEFLRAKAEEALEACQSALDEFIDRLTDDDDDDGPCMCTDCVRVRDKVAGA